MKRIVSASVALAVVLSMVVCFAPPSPAFAAGGSDGLVTRRALVLGNAAYAESALAAPEYDARHMARLFAQMSFTGTTGGAAEQGAMAAVTEKTNRTKRQMLADITAAFAGADTDDVSYFYYSGHGSVLAGEAQLVGVDMACLSLSDLKKALDAIPGTKVILLDSCFSGGFIDRSLDAPQQAARANGPGHYGKKKNPPPPVPKLKKTKGDVLARFPFALARKPAVAPAELDELFNRGVQGAFSRAPVYMNNSSYIVLSASAVDEYSYEMPFSSLYGPSFIMGGIDYAARDRAYSGEFTGMLVAGAGFVAFNGIYGETGLLADYDGDKRLTAAELEHYFKGSVLFSDVRVFPAGEGAAPGESPVLFSHDPGSVVPAVRVRLTDGTADVTTPAGSTAVSVTLDLTGVPAGISRKLAIYKYPKQTDGMAANGFVGQTPVKVFDDVSTGVYTWDGVDASGKDAADGVYKILLECGAGAVLETDPPYLYPGITLTLRRGCSEYAPADKVAFSGGVGGAPYTAFGTAHIASDGEPDCVWFTAPVTGAMNVYADASQLPEGLQAECVLYDADGNVVNYSMTTARDRKLYLPFTVEAGRDYRLKFGITDDDEATGDTGDFGFTLRLNGMVKTDAAVSCGGNAYEAWLIIPEASPEGEYMIRSTGAADTAAVLVDGSQTSVVGSSDDYNDKNFLIRTALLEGHGYLLIAMANPSASGAFRFTVHSPGSAPVFPTAGIPAIEPDEMGYDEALANDDGATSYRLIQTGPKAEKWYFFASGGPDAPLSAANDPSMLLMDSHYNRIGSGDDYDMEYDAAFAAVLEPNGTYILACLSAGMGGYDYSLYAVRQELDASGHAVGRPKAVFMDNGSLSLDRYGTVSAWGQNGYGELGLGSTIPSPTPSVVILPEFGRALDIWAGESMGFARLEENAYCCWGLDELAPVPLYSLDGLDIADIRSGAWGEALVRTYTGELYLLDTADDEIEPVTLPGEGKHDAVGIAATEVSYLALAADGKLFAWGMNWTGECGTGGTGPVENPTRVTFADGALITAVAAGWDHVLALSAEGGVYAWGVNQYDELGLGASFTKRLATRPVKVTGGGIAGKAVASVYAGASHSMCVDTDGNAYGWGANEYGEFGFGDAARLAEPKKIDFYGPGKAAVQAMGAGEAAVFAQDFSHNVYGYGINEDYQLGFAGPPPADGIVKLMTLRGPVETGHSAALGMLHTDNGGIESEGRILTVTIGEGSDACYIVPEPADRDAAVSIGGKKARGILITVPKPGGVSTAVEIRVSHPGGTPADTVYTLTVTRAKSTNADLRTLNVSAGAVLSPKFGKGQYDYRITLPETLGSVNVSPIVDGYAASYAIDTMPKNTARQFRPYVGQTLNSTVKVTAQSGETREYDLTVCRPMMLTALSATPALDGRASLSPGGTNRMTVKYSLSFPATVKLELYKGGKWVTLMTRRETAAGAKTWAWNGKVGGRYLPWGTYKLRVTPVYGGKACTARTIYVRINSRPDVSVPTLSPGVLKPDGLKAVRFGVRWTRITDVKVEIVNARGKVVGTVYTAANRAPATRQFSWNGFIGKKAAPAGTYRVKVTCGSVVKYRAFTVKK